MRSIFFGLFIFLSLINLQAQKKIINKGTIEILYSPGKASNVFIASTVFGAAFDGHSQGDIKKILTARAVA